MKKTKSKFALLSFCGDTWLATDNCKDERELRSTFEDAYRHYVGRKPRRDTVEKFVREREIAAANGLDYYFSY